MKTAAPPVGQDRRYQIARERYFFFFFLGLSSFAAFLIVAAGMLLSRATSFFIAAALMGSTFMRTFSASRRKAGSFMVASKALRSAAPFLAEYFVLVCNSARSRPGCSPDIYLHPSDGVGFLLCSLSPALSGPSSFM